MMPLLSLKMWGRAQTRANWLLRLIGWNFRSNKRAIGFRSCLTLFALLSQLRLDRAREIAKASAHEFSSSVAVVFHNNHFHLRTAKYIALTCLTGRNDTLAVIGQITS